MKAWEFDAVYWDGDVFCVDCLPDDVDVEDPGVYPIFESSEVDEYPVCSVCGFEHDYTGLTEWGIAARKARAAKEEDDDDDETGTDVSKGGTEE